MKQRQCITNAFNFERSGKDQTAINAQGSQQLSCQYDLEKGPAWFRQLKAGGEMSRDTSA